MRKILLGGVLWVLLTQVLWAHLCNDVFIQAKDNLAVKVDIRDDQLRINSKASFRVYLLNTMDRDIVDIRLEVDSDDFKAKVTPSDSWRRYPYLKTCKRGGEKEFFEVELRRKGRTAQGKYKIGLRLFNGKDSSMVFKTVDISDAMGTKVVPRAKTSPLVDGKATRKEWGKSLLCSQLYEYRRAGRYYENCVSEVRTRFRFLHNKKKVYCLIDFKEDSGNDTATILVNRNSTSGTPVEVKANLQQGTVLIDGEKVRGVKVRKRGTKMEFSIPLKAIGIKKQDNMYVNLLRDRGRTKTFWRGNPMSAENPIVYANFVLN